MRILIIASLLMCQTAMADVKKVEVPKTKVNKIENISDKLVLEAYAASDEKKDLPHLTRIAKELGTDTDTLKAAVQSLDAKDSKITSASLKEELEEEKVISDILAIDLF